MQPQEIQKTFRQMYYLTTKAVRLGLLKIVDTQQRKGRAIKRYCCTADVFFVPYSLMKEDLRATFLESELKYLPSKLDAAVHSHPLSESTFCDDEWGKVYTVGGSKRLGAFTNSNKRRFANSNDYVDYLIREHPTPFINLTHKGLKLSLEDAKAWQRELLALNQKYVERAGEGPDHYISLFIAQMPEES